MDFMIPSRTEDFRQRIAEFVDSKILPLEADRASYDDHGNINLTLLDGLRTEAKAEGLWCLQLPKASGGGWF